MKADQIHVLNMRFMGQAKYHFDNSVVDASYRYMTDDWEIDSHTVDTRLRYFLADGSYLGASLSLLHTNGGAVLSNIFNGRSSYS